jgi:hypothetical protein
MNDARGYAAFRAGRADQARQLCEEVARARPPGSQPTICKRIARQLPN